jgi:hypothetical protein
MTQHHHARALCPHLAAAALWMSKTSSGKVRGPRIRYARALRPAMDELLAL